MRYGHYGINKEGSDEEILESLSERVNEIFTQIEQMEDRDPLLKYSMLSDQDIFILSEFFFYFNRPFRRSVRLKANILSSSFFLKPNPALKELPKVVSKNIKWWTKTKINNNYFKEAVKEAIFNYILFSRAYIYIEDNNIVLENSKIKEIEDKLHMTKEDLHLQDLSSYKLNEDITPEKIGKIIEELEEDDRLIDDDEIVGKRDTVITSKMEGYTPQYDGVLRAYSISPREILEVKRFPYLDFITVKLSLFPEITSAISYLKNNYDGDIEYKEVYNILIKMGYGRAIVLKHLLAIASGQDYIEINNNASIRDGLMIHEMIDNTSKLPPILSIIDDCRNHYNGKTKMRELIMEPSKYVTIVSVVNDGNLAEEDNEDILTLHNSIKKSLEDVSDPTSVGTYVIVNKPINVDEVKFGSTQKLEEPQSIITDSEESIYQAFDIPSSLIKNTGSDSYGSGFLKAELLNNEMSNQANDLSQSINKLLDYLFVTKGFVVKGTYGHSLPLTPEIAFDVGAIKDSSETDDILKDLSRDGVVSKTTYLDRIGVDYQEELDRIKQEEKEENEERDIH